MSANSARVQPPSTGGSADIHALQQLLFGLTADEHARLHDQLTDRRKRLELVAEVLAEAMQARNARDSAIGDALAQPIGIALERSIADAPEKIADAIYPVMGPSIRKAIQAALRGMIASMNQMIEQRLSLRSLRWRVDAWRAGMQFSEYILLRNLLFRVEQVYLMHNESGVLLHHVARDDATGTDPDMVSGMLSAMQDFVRDSFQLDNEDLLGEMRISDLTLKIKTGPHATVAAVVRGNAPRELDELLEATTERVHALLGARLTAFDGEVDFAAEAAPELQACLKSQEREPSRSRPSLYVILLWLILGAGLFYVVGTTAARSSQERSTVAALRDAGGYTVVDAGWRGAEYVIDALASPAAPPIDAVLTAKPSWIRVDVAAYVPLAAYENLHAAYENLDPPSTVRLSLGGSVLRIRGTADNRWLGAAKSKIGQLPGVTEIDDSGLALSVEPAAQFAELSDAVAGIHFFFEPEMVLVETVDRSKVTRLANLLYRAQTTAFSMNRQLITTVHGHSDGTGIPERNVTIADGRAHALIEVLRAHGVTTPMAVRSDVAAAASDDPLARYARVQIRLGAEE